MACIGSSASRAFTGKLGPASAHAPTFRMRRPPVGWSLELSAPGLLKPGSGSARLLPLLPPSTRVYLPALPNDPPTAIEEVRERSRLARRLACHYRTALLAALLPCRPPC